MHTELLGGKPKEKGPEWLSRHSDSLRAGRPGDQIPVGARISASVQSSSGAHPASYYKEDLVFPGGKAAEAWR